MSALPDQPPLLRIAPAAPPSLALVRADALTACVQALDPGSRALLDLSLRRRLPLEAMAVVLRTDPFDLARRRARAVARIAAELDLEGPGVVACVRSSLAQLPDAAWGVQLPKPEPVQAEVMKVSAQALMAKLRQRQLQEAEARRKEIEAEEEPAVTEPSVADPDPLALGSAFSLPSPTSPFSASFARIADEEELTDAAAEAIAAKVIASQSEPLPAEPEEVTVVEGSAETIEFVAVTREDPAPATAPAPEPVALTHVAQPRRRKLARGGLLVAIFAALLRLLFRH